MSTIRSFASQVPATVVYIAVGVLLIGLHASLEIGSQVQNLTYDVVLDVQCGGSSSRTVTQWVVQNLALVGLQPGVQHEVFVDPLDPAIVTPPEPNMELSLTWIHPRLKALPE